MKADKYSSCYFFLSLLRQEVYFHETNYCIILSHFLHLLAKVFQNRCSFKIFSLFTGKPASQFHFNQPVAWYFFNKRLRHRYFLVNFVKLSRTPFLQSTLGLLLLYLLNISVMSPNLVFSPKWLVQPFETLINIEMYTCEKKKEK